MIVTRFSLLIFLLLPIVFFIPIKSVKELSKAEQRRRSELHRIDSEKSAKLCCPSCGWRFPVERYESFLRIHVKYFHSEESTETPEQLADRLGKSSLEGSTKRIQLPPSVPARKKQKKPTKKVSSPRTKQQRGDRQLAKDMLRQDFKANHPQRRRKKTNTFSYGSDKQAVWTEEH